MRKQERACRGGCEPPHWTQWELLTCAKKFGGASARSYVLVEGLAWEMVNPRLISGMMEIYPRVEGNRHGLTEKFVRGMHRKPRSEEFIERLVDAVTKTLSDTADRALTTPEGRLSTSTPRQLSCAGG